MKYSRLVTITCAIAVLSLGGYAVYDYKVSNQKPKEPNQINRFDDLKNYMSHLQNELDTLRASDDDSDAVEKKLALDKKLEGLAEDISTLQKQLQTITNTVSAMQREDTAMLVGQVQVEEVEENSDPAPPGFEGDTDDRMQEAEEAQREYLSIVDSSLGEEPVDIEWSSATTNLIEQAFESEELMTAAIVDVDCRSTLCRVEVEHANQADMAGFELWFPHKVNEELGKFTMHHEDRGDGGITTVLYMARSGYSLPGVE